MRFKRSIFSPVLQKKRKAEQELAREQRKAADELRKQEKEKEQRRVQMNVIRGQLRASVCIGLDRSKLVPHIGFC